MICSRLEQWCRLASLAEDDLSDAAVRTRARLTHFEWCVPAPWMQFPHAEHSASRHVAELVCDDPAMTIPRIASRSSMSRRKLEKHLENEGTTIRGVQDEIRRAVALYLLLCPDLTMERHIAPLLGFSSKNGFKWWRRTIGIATSEYRKAFVRLKRENGLEWKVFLITGWLFLSPDLPPLQLGLRFCDGSGRPHENPWKPAKHRVAVARLHWGRAAYEAGLSDADKDLLMLVLATHLSGLLNPERSLHPPSDEDTHAQLSAAIGVEKALAFEHVQRARHAPGFWEIHAHRWKASPELSAGENALQYGLLRLELCLRELAEPLRPEQKHELAARPWTEPSRADHHPHDLGDLVRQFGSRRRADGSYVLEGRQRRVLLADHQRRNAMHASIWLSARSSA